MPQKHCFILTMIAFSLYDTVLYSYCMILFRSCRFYTNEHGNMFYICLSIVSILYVCTGCCVLFVSCNKKKMFGMYILPFSRVSLSFFRFLGFFSFFLPDWWLWKCISNIQSLYLKFDAFSKFRHVIELSRDHWRSFYYLVLLYLAVLSSYSLFTFVL